jgi:hypothetical protein
MARRIVIWRAMAAVALAVALLSAAPETQAASTGNHCIVEASRYPVTTGAARCFATFSQAQAAASGPRFLAVAYQQANYGGGTLIIYSTTGRCNGADLFYVMSLPSGWDNQISSIRFFGGCSWATLYEQVKLAGTVKYVHYDAASLGSFNDRTSSMRFF